MKSNQMLLLVATLLLLLGAVLLLSPTVAWANSPASLFEGSDGNLVFDTPGNQDLNNAPNRATVNIRKTDNSNPPRPLSGAVFTLFSDGVPLGGQPEASDTTTTYTCTTNNRGECSIQNVQPAQYWVVETTPPLGYTPALPQSVKLLSGVTTRLVFTDTGKPGSLNVHVQDDDKPANPFKNVGVALLASKEVTTATCTTDDLGNCSIVNVPSGNYTLKQTTTVAGYSPAPDQKIMILSGQPISVTLTDKRQFKVIVIVCQESTGQLYASNVRTDGVTKITLSAVDATALCSLGGASFDDQAIGNHAFTVNIPE